jgi:branched-chain amino acid transport system substrate-binding protein
LNKIQFLLGVVVVVALIAVFVGALQPQGLFIFQNKDHALRLGAVFPLTGPISSYGQTWSKSFSLAISDFEEQNDVNVDFFIEDSQMDPKLALSSAQKLIQLNNVQAIIPGSSREALAIIPLTEENDVLVVTAASNPKITENRNFVFRIVPSDFIQGKDLAQFALNKGLKSFSVLSLQSDYGIGLTNVFEKNLLNGGARIDFKEFFSESETDFRTHLLKIKNAASQGVLIIAMDKQYVSILSQMKELGLKQKVFASEVFNSGVVLENTELVKGVVYSKYLAVSNPISSKFEAEYFSRFGEKPGPFAAETYDATLVALKALFNSSNSKGAKDFLHTSTFSGVTGNIQFDLNGEPIGKSFTLVEIPSS